MTTDSVVIVLVIIVRVVVVPVGVVVMFLLRMCYSRCVVTSFVPESPVLFNLA